MRKAIVFVALAFLLMLGATPVYADGVPPLPHAFYGDVTINGSPAPIGTTVEARGSGVLTGIEGNPITTTERGKYGSPNPLEPRLIVQGDIQDGAALTFYVNGVSTGQTAEWHSGETTEFNLSLVSNIIAQKVETVPAGQTDYVIDFSAQANTTITVNTVGEVVITVKKYQSNPHPEAPLPADMLPRYIDIEIDNLDVVDWPMYVKQTYTDAEVTGLVESSLGMYYFKAADNAWHRCSDTGVNTGANYVWANMTRDELSGSPVAIGGTAEAPPPSGDGGLPPAITTLSLAGLTATPALKVNSSGIVQSTCHLKTADSKLTLDIAKGVKLLNSQGNPLASLSAVTEPSPPEPPSGEALVMAYNLGPDGATFSPEITLTLKYDPATLPEDVDEEDLYIAYWRVGPKWVPIGTTVNAEANTASCELSHFTPFALIAPSGPAAFSISNLSIKPAEVQPRQTITITVSVSNTGGRQGSYTVVLKINGVKEADKSVTVAAGKSQDVSFSVTKEEAGTYSAEVDGLSGSFTVVAPGPPLPIAVVSVTNLSIEPAQVEPNEAVTVSVVVANTGDTEGSYTVVLKIDDVKEAERQVTVPAGGSQDVSFSVTREEAGTYSVEVDGLSGSFTVVTPAPVLPTKPAINWPLIGGIIAAVVVVGLLIFFLVRRRAY